MQITFTFRSFFSQFKKYKKSEREVRTFIDVISKLNFESFVTNLKVLETIVNPSYILEIQNKLDIFHKEIQKITNVIRKT